MKDKKRKFLYGPVPSRRLGLSYGIDVVPFKVCTLDCVYCQLGRTTIKTTERKDYIPIESVLIELKEAISENKKADYITLAGSGEPTLHAHLGSLIVGIKEITNTAIAILTNGTLLHREDVRADCAKADVVMPSLDAGDQQTFRRINRPHDNISIEKLVSGLCAFRDEFAGQIWLEVFFVEGTNTDAEQIAGIKDAIQLIRPDKVHLNTAVRPTADPGIERLDPERLRAIAAGLGPGCEVIADFSHAPGGRLPKRGTEDILGSGFEIRRKTEALFSMLKRRPCSLDDICSGLGVGRNEALKYISDLQHRGVIQSERKDGSVFFKTSS